MAYIQMIYFEAFGDEVWTCYDYDMINEKHKYYNTWFSGSVTFFSVAIMQKSVDTVEGERFAKHAG